MQIRRPLCLVSLVFTALIMICVYSGDTPAERSAAIDGYGARSEASVPKEGEQIELTGLVDDKEYKIRYGSRIPILYIKPVEDKRDSIQYDNTVMCYMTDVGGEEIPHIEETVRLSGKVSLFREATNPGEFNLREYYQILDISFKLNQIKILARSGSESLIKEKLFQLKCRCADVLDEIYPVKEASVLKAMLLGEKSGLDAEVKELYQLNGLIHILSISGLHISLLGMTLYKLLKKCLMPLYLRAPFVIGMMWCYGMMTGMGISTWRAIFMFVLHLAAEIVGRTYDMLTALALAGMLMLAERPLLVKHSGFLLSFGAVLGIGVVLPLWKEILEGLKGNIFLKKENAVKRFYGKDGKAAEGFHRKVIGFIWEGFVLSTAIAVTTLPILLYFYYTYPVYSLLLNIVVIPLMSVVLAVGMLSMGMGLFLPEIALYAGLPDRLILQLYEIFCKSALRIPKGIVIGGRPAFWQIILYYGILAILVTERNFAEEKRNRICLSPLNRWLILLGIIQLIFLRPISGLTTYFLDVGQGDCIVMVNENGNCYMVDGGSSDKSEVGRYQILPFLESKGIGELEAVFLTHPDKDHISGVLEMTKQSEYGVHIKKLILPDVAESMKNQELAELRQTASAYDIPVYYVGRGDVLKDAKLMIYCIGPRKGLATDEVNEISTVLSVSYGDFSMLLTGDVTGESEKEMMMEWKKQRAKDGERQTEWEKQKLTVLKVAHHGSRFSTPKELLELTNPVYAVISAGEGNSYGHPHRELLERLEEEGTRMLLTSKSGAITFHTDGRRMRVEEFLGNVR